MDGRTGADAPSAGALVRRTTETWLDEHQLREAESIHTLAQQHRIASPFEALQWYTVHAPAARGAPPLVALIEDFLRIKTAEQVSTATLATYRENLEKFAQEFGSRQPVSVTPREIVVYLRRWPHPPSLKHRR